MRWAQVERVVVTQDLGNIGVSQMGKELGKRWLTVPTEVKAKFEAEYQADKARYNTEMQSYTPSAEFQARLSLAKSNSKSNNSKVAEKIKDPNAPKRPLR